MKNVLGALTVALVASVVPSGLLAQDRAEVCFESWQYDKAECEKIAAQLDQLKSDKEFGSIRALKPVVLTWSEGQGARLYGAWVLSWVEVGASSYFSYDNFENHIEVANAFALHGLKNSKSYKQSRINALISIVHGIVSARAEFEQCADKGGAIDQSKQFVANLEQSGLLNLSAADRAFAGAAAFEMEAATWGVRKQIDDSGFLCIDGNASAPGSAAPQRRANDQWWPDAEAQRAGNKAFIVALLKLEPGSLDPSE